MMPLFLEPIDVWLFRDGRPFDANSDHRATSLFPPYPSVMQGVIRSHQLVVKQVDLRSKAAIIQAVGTADDYGTLRLRGPFIAKRDKDHIVRYFPQPADAVTVNKVDHTLKLASAPTIPSNRVRTSAVTPQLIGLGNEPHKAETGLWLSEDELKKYFIGDEATGTPAKELFEKETRFGIACDDAKRTTKEGTLYEVEFIRPCEDVGLYVEVGGYDNWPEKAGVLRIGGEGRGAHYEQISALKEFDAPKALPKQFRVYFATPTYFESGWQPKIWRKFFEGEVELVAAAVGRHESLGGFDWASNQHKSARRYVPAGSVYYFQQQGGAQFAQDSITDFGAAIGFGQIIITEW